MHSKIPHCRSHSHNKRSWGRKGNIKSVLYLFIKIFCCEIMVFRDTSTIATLVFFPLTSKEESAWRKVYSHCSKQNKNNNKNKQTNKNLMSESKVCKNTWSPLVHHKNLNLDVACQPGKLLIATSLYWIRNVSCSQSSREIKHVLNFKHMCKSIGFMYMFKCFAELGPVKK